MSITTQQLEQESWLARRLRDHGVDVFAGTTDRRLRAERARNAIVTAGITSVIVGRGKDGKPRTYAEVFEAIYGEPLIKSTTRNVPRETSEPQSGG